MADDANIAWLAAYYQIPKEDALARAGRFLSQPPPLTPRYEAWLKETGGQAWAGFLRHHPGWVWTTYRREHQYSFIPADYLAVQSEKWKASLIGLSISLQWIFYQAVGWLFELKALNALLALGAAALGLGWIWSSAGILPASPGRLEACATLLRRARLGTLTWLVGTAALAALVAILGDTIETWRHAIVGLIAIYAALPIGAAALANPLVEWVIKMRNADYGMRTDTKKPPRTAKKPRQKR